jgi:multiple sugar transport system ATP-binding protein
MAEILLEQVCKIYPGGVKAVKEVNLAVRDAEFVVLVGPSGCGKTTTLRMVAGLEEISGGTIRIGDRVINDVPPKDRDIAMVFQNYALYPHMSVYKNMAFGLILRKLPKDQIRSRVLDAAKILGIDHLLDRKPKQLSGGQRQRVAVGRAIVRQPQAFLFDEPLSNLDAKMRVEMRAELKKLHRKLRTTTLYVTHDQEEAMTLGDRVVVMKDGEIQQVDVPLKIYDQPVNHFVAGFLGTPPMNFFNGRVAFQNNQPYFMDGPNSLLLPEKWRERLERYKDQPMVLGMRPENFHLQPNEYLSENQAMKVRVEVIEPLGDKIDVYVSSATHPHIVCRIDAHSKLAEGQERTFYLDIHRAHLFTPDEIGTNVTLE